MSSLVFADMITTIPAAWLNDVNSVIYTLFGNGTTYSGAATFPSTLSVTGNTTLTGTLSVTGISVFTGNMALSSAAVGSNKNFSVTNTDNTNTASGAKVSLVVGGTSAGDPFVQFVVTGGETWSVGVDNSDSDKFKISKNAALGTSDMMKIDTSGNVVIPGNLDAPAILFNGGTNGSLQNAQSGQFTVTMTGVSGTVTGNVYFSLIGGTATAGSGCLVSLDFDVISGTSNSSACTFTGMPDKLKPAHTKYFIGRVQDAGTYAAALIQIGTDGVVTLFKDVPGTGFTTSGTKGIGSTNLTYTNF